jgi:hypothetical protein
LVCQQHNNSRKASPSKKKHLERETHEALCLSCPGAALFYSAGSPLPQAKTPSPHLLLPSLPPLSAFPTQPDRLPCPGRGDSPEIPRDSARIRGSPRCSLANRRGSGPGLEVGQGRPIRSLTLAPRVGARFRYDEQANLLGSWVWFWFACADSVIGRRRDARSSREYPRGVDCKKAHRPRAGSRQLIEQYAVTVVAVCELDVACYI